jgi:ParB family chromosome partitioning protein
LLEPNELAEAGPSITRDLPLELVDENPNNPRRQLIEVEDLAASIHKFGLLQPVTVRRAGERYELLGGHRRRAAINLLHDLEPHDPRWRTVAAVVRTFDDQDAYLALLAGQLQNRAWQPREEAAALEALAETRTLREVGALVHRSESWVGRRLRVYADSVLSAYVQTRQLLPIVAHELLVLAPEQRRVLAEQAVAEGWSREQARGEVRKLKRSAMIGQIGRLARDLLEALALVQPGDVPLETASVLAKVRGRILALGRGTVMPTIEAAERAAGIKADRPGRAPRGRRKPGYKPRT